VTNLKIGALLVMFALVIGSWYLTCAAGRYDDVTAGFFPLEMRHFERLTLIAVGTGGAYEDHNRAGPSTAVGIGQQIWLVDAGRGLANALRKSKIPMAQPDTVLLTSLLPENTLGLDDLLAASWLEGRRERIRLLGPPGTAALARNIEAAVRPGLEIWSRGLEEDLGDPGFEAIEIADDWTAAGESMEVRAGALPGGPTTALAYRFDWRGRILVIGGSGFNDDALVEFSRGAHTLVHEANYIPTEEEARQAELAIDPAELERQTRMHTTLAQVGRLAMRAGVETLVLVRLRPPPVYTLQVTSFVNDSFDGNILVPGDGDEITP
jgi:ribonuclease BN (tRNA processing enzyme)